MEKPMKETLLDKALLGTISDLEMKSLRALYGTQQDFDKEMKLITDIYKGIEFVSDEELKLKLNDIHERVITNQKKGEFRLKNIYLVISGVAAAIALFFLVQVLSQKESPAELFASYYSPYVTSLDTRSAENEKLITSFEKAYRNESYEEALNMIDPTLLEMESEVQLMAGVAAMEAGRNEKATEVFMSIVDSKNEYYSDHAVWYLALLNLKLEQFEEAKTYLKQLVNSTSRDHHLEAKKLLKKLP